MYCWCSPSAGLKFQVLNNWEINNYDSILTIKLFIIHMWVTDVDDTDK